MKIFKLLFIFVLSLIISGCFDKPSEDTPPVVYPYQFETVSGFAYFENENGGGWSSYTNPESIMFIEEEYYRIFVNRNSREFDYVEIKDKNTLIIHLKKVD